MQREIQLKLLFIGKYCVRDSLDQTKCKEININKLEKLQKYFVAICLTVFFIQCPFLLLVTLLWPLVSI